MILKTEMAARVTLNVINDELPRQGYTAGSVYVPEQEACDRESGSWEAARGSSSKRHLHAG